MNWTLAPPTVVWIGVAPFFFFFFFYDKFIKQLYATDLFGKIIIIVVIIIIIIIIIIILMKTHTQERGDNKMVII